MVSPLMSQFAAGLRCPSAGTCRQSHLPLSSEWSEFTFLAQLLLFTVQPGPYVAEERSNLRVQTLKPRSHRQALL